MTREAGKSMDEQRPDYYSKKLWLQIIAGQREDEESYNRQERLRDSRRWKVASGERVKG